jgi:multiple sugar transport system substrate-binding protein
MGSDAPLVDIAPDKLVDFECAVRMVPQVDPEHPQMISQGPSVCLFNKKDPQEVLASWLFAQYLLTNDVQIAYAETEGYVPVTTKAQETEEYQSYLAAAGTDGKEHYRVKIEATRVLLDHAGDTCVTPVFNGSASLRDAAGQLIENTAKSVRRHEKVDDAYFDALFDDVLALYHLDSLGGGVGADPSDLGPLPRASKILLASLAIAWAGIAAVWLHERRAGRKS